MRDHYNQTVIRLTQTSPPHRELQLTFRAYDSGAAFCYTIPAEAGIERVDISREDSEFRFLGDHAAWAVYSAQGIYQKVTLARCTAGCR